MEIQEKSVFPGIITASTDSKNDYKNVGKFYLPFFVLCREAYQVV